jgi:hypothetical protein
VSTPNLSNPHVLLAELKSRQEKRQSINDLLDYILPVVEAATKLPHPDYWVSKRLTYWANYPGTLEADVKPWRLTADQLATLAKAFEKLKP